MLLLVLLNVLILLVPEFSTRDFPSSLPTCYIDDPKINECLLNAAIMLKPQIRKGIKELGIPSYDPLRISAYSVLQESDLVNFTASLTNFTVRGMDNYDITEFRYNPKTLTFSGKMEFDPLYIDSGYIFNGKLVAIPVIGKGSAQLDLGPIKGMFEITGRIVDKQNVKFYDPTDVKIKLNIDDASANSDGFFDNNVELGRVTLELLNRNSKLIVSAGTPAIENLVQSFLMRYLKWLTKTYSYDTMFPRSK